MFADRSEAGRRLAEKLRPLAGEDVVVLGLPRGGVPVAFEVADALAAPLDVILVRKLGVPIRPELAFGAIGEDGVRVLNHDIVRGAALRQEDMAAVEARERAELQRRAEQIRSGRPKIDLTGRTAIVVDDGIATGATVRAACQVARAQGAARVIVGTPVCPPETAVRLRQEAADDVVCVLTPAALTAIGQWYADFTQVSEEHVAELLSCGTGLSEEVWIEAGDAALPGELVVPRGAHAVVVFVHGSGSSRSSPRNRYVATALNKAGLGTLLFDLLTSAEETDRANVFDISLLAGRLSEATEWLRKYLPHVVIGYFGASTGAAAALWAAAVPQAGITAVVSRGGRPDLAESRLAGVAAPTLLIVGGNDTQVLELNRAAQALLRCENRLAVVPGAGHLFEEPGALEAVSALAREWFTRHL
ncbi:phosphoribosyltransferase [Nonomuraea africana]|uniref:Phosphoribosyltransferase/putative alpha/beta-hydrolase family hydrolase n=1 Tax=Nonomuraea africana TaxID=46171 RepID=A0ABR9KLV7_9ACTN|nr:phosphoribosyltransferase [Nonomuraea africana]MBE1562785.1 putative phosphoribosyltransferase/putative alpha/beta-hydrolase family hydrolase [Nonomuraea africana]